MVEKAFTHGGRFHADDVFSAALLTYLYPDICIERGFDIPKDYQGIIFDIGFGAFDHHQEQKEIRENGVPYAAFGLLWREFGEQILGRELAQKFDEAFIQPLDIADNTGMKNDLCEIISIFNPSWDEEGDEDLCFLRAKEVALQILKRKFVYIKGEKKAEQIIKEAMAKSQNHILVLKEFVPWKRSLKETDIYFVVYPSKRGGYNAQGIPKDDDKTELKCYFLEQWRGKTEGKLKEISGIRTMNFCHTSGFLVATDTLEDAIKACEISMKDMVLG